MEITQDLLHELFIFDGQNLVRKISVNSRAREGDIVNSYSDGGYLKVKINRRMYKVHRIIWFMQYGYWPDEIDHINGIKDDNRLENLREVNHEENCKNRLMRRDNTSGVTGVSFEKRRNRWIARTSINGKEKYLGSFKNLEEAEQRVIDARGENGYTIRHGTVE